MSGSWNSKSYSVGGILTADMIDDAAKMALDRYGEPTPPGFIPLKEMKGLIEWQKREAYWKSLGPLGEKKERLRWRLKHRDKHMVVNLPE